MRILAVAGVSLAAMAMPAMAQVYVRPHVRSDGTYVQGHMRTAPNSSRLDNWSTQPNYNPYTGRTGTVNPYSPPTYQPRSYQPFQPVRPVRPITPNLYTPTCTYTPCF